MLIVFIGLTFLSTFAGGVVGLRHKDKLHLILGFTAGVLLGVVAFDIFPEIITMVGELKMDPIGPMLALVGGFLLFHVLEKMLLIHHAQEGAYGAHKHPTVGKLSALALAGHSFLDGVGIGLGFKISLSIGVAISLAVIAHDFSDGLNTVSLMLVHKNTSKKALIFLLFDAVAPVLGALSTLWFRVGQNLLVWYLGFFAGFLLYIGASDILPEAHSQQSSWKTIVMTFFGAGLVLAVSGIR